MLVPGPASCRGHRSTSVRTSNPTLSCNAMAFVDGAIFYFFELSSSDGASGELFLSRKQFRRSKQAADDVGVGGDHAFPNRDSMVPSWLVPRTIKSN